MREIRNVNVKMMMACGNCPASRIVMGTSKDDGGHDGCSIILMVLKPMCTELMVGCRSAMTFVSCNIHQVLDSISSSGTLVISLRKNRKLYFKLLGRYSGWSWVTKPAEVINHSLLCTASFAPWKNKQTRGYCLQCVCKLCFECSLVQVSNGNW